MENSYQDFKQNSNEASGGENVKEVHYYYHRRSGFNPGKIFLGLLVVFIGLIYLAKNTGFLSLDLNFYWWNFWPVIIIFIGLFMMNFRGFLGAIFSLLIALLALATILFLLLGPVNLINRSDSSWSQFNNFRLNCRR